MSRTLAKLVRSELGVDRNRKMLRLVKALPQHVKAEIRRRKGLLRAMFIGVVRASREV
jgi:hypothetical protein